MILRVAAKELMRGAVEALGVEECRLLASRFFVREQVSQNGISFTPSEVEVDGRCQRGDNWERARMLVPDAQRSLPAHARSQQGDAGWFHIALVCQPPKNVLDDIGFRGHLCVELGTDAIEPPVGAGARSHQTHPSLEKRPSEIGVIGQALEVDTVEVDHRVAMFVERVRSEPLAGVAGDRNSFDRGVHGRVLSMADGDS